ncbi:acyl-CoA dehydrogenase family protein [Amycolatopsis nigrescens]|uniref:acyl-CoA dehydrogenase family protein n=1 Tax=Amycolatopsis nigrescens TaxID=381445 RepID=UPI000362327A|nr:acyl-CoA dehydrogenase family protein [Amycolatopsis nigrescens]
MDFTWSEAQSALYQRLRTMAARELAEDVVGRDQAQEFSPGGWKRCAAEGVLGLPIPPEYGGLGCDPVTCALALEGLGYGCRDNGLLMSVGAHVWAVEVPIWLFGSAEQKQRLLPELCAGRMIGAHAITEPESGSDALSLSTHARSGDGCYVLNGRKRFVTNGPIADVMIVYATIDPDLGFTGVTAFLVTRDQPGLRIEPGPPKAGLRTAPWAELVLENCEVPIDRRLGAEKQGRTIFATTMAWERALILAPLLGAMQRQIDDCLRFAQRRRQFGRRIGSFQSVAHAIADMQVRLESARLLTYRAAAELDGTAGGSMFPEMAKLQTSEAAVQTFMAALEIHGGHGYTVDAEIERDLRDALGTRISSGTSAMQRTVIAGKLGLRQGSTP